MHDYYLFTQQSKHRTIYIENNRENGWGVVVYYYVLNDHKNFSKKFMII